MGIRDSVKNSFHGALKTVLPTSPHCIKDLTPVFDAELKRIQERRRKVGLPDGNPQRDSVGIALSGGGIRSATFNLGLLQSMQRYNALKHADYLSTVSGGGYIGSCLTWFMSVKGTGFPFGVARTDHKSMGGMVLAWIRAHGKFLAPGKGLSLWSLVAATLCGILINLLVVVPLLMLAVWGLAMEIPQWMQLEILEDIKLHFHGVETMTAFALLLITGHLLLVLFLVLCISYALFSHSLQFQKFCAQREFRVATGVILMIAVIFLCISSIPYVYDWLKGYLPTLLSSVTLSGVISLVSGLFFTNTKRDTKNLTGPVLLSVGLSLICYGLFLLFYHAIIGSNSDTYDPSLPGIFWYLLLPLSLLLSMFANINHVSMHRFYRNRLMEAYMPPLGSEADAGDNHHEMEKADDCLLKDIVQQAAPYHLVCCNIQTVGSDQPKLRERGGDCFIFSPEYCGSWCTGYVPTSVFMGGKMDLATTMAISGAAVDPNTDITRSRPLTFLMSLFNVRLGYWLPNPRYTMWNIRPLWWWYMFREMLGKGLNEKCRNVHLSDGGHFENLGMYELVRRRCKTIIVSDAGADPEWLFGDLARAIERVRVDFGARVDINTVKMRPAGEDQLSQQAWVRGTIAYDDEESTTADFLYIKTAVIPDLTEDIYGYRRVNDKFPDQTTTDQFFDEAQFEAYRELGFQVGRKIFKDKQDWDEVINQMEQTGRTD